VTKNTEKKSFDPDRLSLQKKDISEFCERVLSKWQTDPLTTETIRNIAAMVAVRTAVYFTDEER
jgi:hypothetical protein